MHPAHSPHTFLYEETSPSRAMGVSPPITLYFRLLIISQLRLQCLMLQELQDLLLSKQHH